MHRSLKKNLSERFVRTFSCERLLQWNCDIDTFFLAIYKSSFLLGIGGEFFVIFFFFVLFFVSIALFGHAFFF